MVRLKGPKIIERSKEIKDKIKTNLIGPISGDGNMPQN